MSVWPLPVGFRLGQQMFHDWEPRFTVSRELAQDGSEFCICWVGTFRLVTDDNGGYMGEEGVALGITPDGDPMIDVEWSGDLDLSEPREETSPLAKWVPMARNLAACATLLIPAVEEAFEIGADLERTLQALEQDPTLRSNVGEVMQVALGLLWLAEGARREREAAGS